MEKIKNFDLKGRTHQLVVFLTMAFAFYLVFIILADARKVRALSTDFDWRIVPIVLILNLASYLVRGGRFHFLLRSAQIRLSFSQSLSVFLAGIAMTVTPGKTGEAIKSYLIKKAVGYGYTRTLPIVVFERVMDAVAMIILSFGGLYLFRRALIFYLFFSLLVVGFLALIHFRGGVIWLMGKFEKRVNLQIIDFIRLFLDGSQRLLRPKILSLSVLLSVIAWGLQGGSLLLLLTQFQPFLGSTSWWVLLLYALFIFCFSSIAGFLLLIPAGVGVAEGSLVSFLVLFFKLKLSEAVFVTLLFRFATLWFGVGLGSGFLLKLVYRINRKKRQDVF